MKMRTYFVAVAVVLIATLPFGDISAAAEREPIQTRANNAFVTSMTAIADGYQAATEMAVAAGELIVCPVPGSTFVDSWGAPRSGGRSHQGVDMMAANGTPIYAPASGDLTFRSVSLGGLSFYIDTPTGAQFFGTHLSGYEGTDRPVTAGDLIGYVGATGNAGTPHLHFEHHPDGTTPVNPYPITAAACSSPPPPAPRSMSAMTESSRINLSAITARDLNFCRYVTGGRIDYRLVRCLHIAAGFTPGTPGHTIDVFRAEARQLRRFLSGFARTCSGPGDCPALIRAAFTHMGIAWRGSEAVGVAICESGLNPSVRGGGGGNYAGLFQQSLTYWPGRAATYGMAGRSPYDPWANAVVSAGMVRDTGGWSHWACSP